MAGVGLLWPCERPRQGPCRGPDKGLAMALWLSPAGILPGVLWVSSARISSRFVVFYSSDLKCSLSSQRSACHHGGASRAIVPTRLAALEELGLKGGAPCWRRVGCPGKGLVGAAEAAPGKVPAGGTCFASLLPCVLGLGVALAILGFGFTLVHLHCSAWCGRGRGSDCPCTGKGVQKERPYFSTPTGAPGPGPHISATHCWARPRTVRGQAGRFLPWYLSVRYASPRPALNA